MEYNGVLGEKMGQKSLDFLQALTPSSEGGGEQRNGGGRREEEEGFCINLKCDKVVVEDRGFEKICLKSCCRGQRHLLKKKIYKATVQDNGICLKKIIKKNYKTTMKTTIFS